MKAKFKKLFVLGAGVALAGLTVANKKKIKKAVDSLVKKGKLTAKEGKELSKELLAEGKKSEKKMKKIVNKHVKKEKKKTKKPSKKKKKTAKKKK
ncbi:hypothetical protein GF327_10170 [Candidatus Woesearchaeota archaeon]|nr:hypothetical protein [Candidatus Woesearchaeota archaeon]